MSNKKKFTQEYKEETVKYYEESGKSVKTVSQEMGIGNSTLARWVSKYKKNSGKIESRGSGNHSSNKDKEISRLRKELKDTEDALMILKKAMGILRK